MIVSAYILFFLPLQKIIKEKKMIIENIEKEKELLSQYFGGEKRSHLEQYD